MYYFSFSNIFLLKDFNEAHMYKSFYLPFSVMKIKGLLYFSLVYNRRSRIPFGQTYNQSEAICINIKWKGEFHTSLKGLN